MNIQHSQPECIEYLVIPTYLIKRSIFIVIPLREQRSQFSAFHFLDADQ